jgi:hypothetical protein
VTLAHISDLHLSPVEGFGPRHWNMKRGLGFLNWHQRRKTVHLRDVVTRSSPTCWRKRPTTSR